jgi:hypothetical protein
MKSIGRGILAGVFALAMVGVVSACGGSSSTAGSPSSSPAGAATTVATTPAGGSEQAFCGVVQSQKATIQGTELAGLLTGGTPAAWQAYLEKTAAMNQQLVDAAPAEVLASVKTLQAGTIELQNTMKAANYDVSKIGAAQLIKLFQSQERKDASAALVTYVKAHCGLDLTAP